MNTIRNPDAAVVLFNYKSRSGSEGIAPESVDSLGGTYIIKDPIVSITTGKEKAHPVGQFQIVLAPTRNWTSFVSPGSWLTIHMAPRKITDEEVLASSEETLKMIGRVDTVRVNISVDQQTGARHTSYIIAGRDWGQIFESSLYIDAGATFSEDNSIAVLTRLDFNETFSKMVTDKNNFVTTNLVKFFLYIWGKSSVDNIFENSGLNAKRYSAKSEFKVPSKLADILNSQNLTVESATQLNNLADLIKVIAGKLVADDKYTDYFEAVGMVDGHSLIGTNNIWQLMSVHMCDIVNELVSELRWDANESIDIIKKPSLTIYKRIKPFAITSKNVSFDTSTLTTSVSENLVNHTQAPLGSPLLQGGAVGKNTEKVTSSFFLLKKTFLSAGDVLNLEAGTNWRDAVNFIELLPALSWIGDSTGTAGKNIQTQNKNNSAIFDPNGTMISREGLRPMMLSTVHSPPDDDGVPKPDDLIEWLPVLKNWYFDTHKMLNGSASFMGQPKYIPVGSNIVFDSKLFGAQFLPKGQPLDVSVLAHIESVSNNFSYTEDGGRSFTTSVTFVRGIMTDSTGSKQVADGVFALTDDADNLNEEILKTTGKFVIEAKNN